MKFGNKSPHSQRQFGNAEELNKQSLAFSKDSKCNPSDIEKLKETVLNQDQLLSIPRTDPFQMNRDSSQRIVGRQTTGQQDWRS
ncbi:MAG: hypothetical protein O2960_16825, partial [Verrucomicrobia bacterium]|nr:hypothetical protein [Verrucomicrobiota bacterium]